ncbi:MAG: hypothetical protein ACTSYD_03205 [Candidatus Heimdallarchaeaceae archaeon]
MSLKHRILSSLGDLISLKDVRASLLFRLDGEVIYAKYKNVGENIQIMMRALLWAKANIEQIAFHIQKNNLKKAIYELEKTSILFFSVSKTTILCLICSEAANLSLISIEAKRYAKLMKKKKGDLYANIYGN